MSKLTEEERDEVVAAIDYRIESYMEDGTEGDETCPLCEEYGDCIKCPADIRYNGVLEICSEYDDIQSRGEVAQIIAGLQRLRRNVKRWKVVE